MSNDNYNPTKIVMGIILGGAVGATALYLLRNTERKTPIMQKIGKTMTEVGEMLEKGELTDKMVHAVEKNTPSATEMISTVADWVDTGLNLWKRFKK